MTTFPDGFLWGGEYGELGEYRSDQGFCPHENLHPEGSWFIGEADRLLHLVGRGDMGVARATVVRRF